MKTSGYLPQADIVRVLSIAMVIGIHLLTAIYARPDFFGGGFWWVTFLLNCVFRICVPLFVMLSGYLLLTKPIELESHLRKTVRRILIPLGVFYILVHISWFLAAYLRSEPYDVAAFFHYINMNTRSHLYFLVILFFLYCVAPIFRLVIEKSPQKLFPYLLVFFLGHGALATLMRYVSLREGEVFHTYALWVLWIGYFLAGAFVRMHQDWLQTQRWRLAAMFLLGLLLTVGLGYLAFSLHMTGNDQWYIGGEIYPNEYLGVPVMMMALPAFSLLMTMRVPRWLSTDSLPKILLRRMAEVSFALYLVHTMVMDYLNKFFGVTADSGMFSSLPEYVLVNAFWTLVISGSIAIIFTYTPVLKKAVGR